MADKPEPKQKQQKEEPPAAPLGSAGASIDPRVHQLLAERATAASNSDGDAVQAIDGQLADLGVSAEL